VAHKASRAAAHRAARAEVHRAPQPEARQAPAQRLPPAEAPKPSQAQAQWLARPGARVEGRRLAPAQAALGSALGLSQPVAREPARVPPWVVPDRRHQPSPAPWRLPVPLVACPPEPPGSERMVAADTWSRTCAELLACADWGTGLDWRSCQDGLPCSRHSSLAPPKARFDLARVRGGARGGAATARTPGQRLARHKKGTRDQRRPPSTTRRT
jgi:hypothetical protein